jgi:hypothetical protein
MRSTQPLFAAVAVLALCGAAGCSRSKPGKATAQATPQTPASSVLEGTVLETLAAPPYSYLRLKTPSGEVWAAVPANDLKVGASVAVTVQIRMEKFESPSLKRTFSPLVMGTLGGTPAPGAALPAGAHPMTAPAMAVPGTPAPPDEKVAKAAGADAHTVAELFARSKALANATVTVKGKVVKYNEGIMGKNWIHLRDGSGAAASRDNDLTVTTKDASKLGDVVTVKGVVHVDKDFGMGYTYPVIIEDGKIVK